MQIHRQFPARFLFAALLPHRDCRRLIRDYRRALFAAGMRGAYSFPELAPLAVTARPWTREELGAVARSLRARYGAFQTSGGRFSRCPGGPLLWGPALNCSLADLASFPLPAGSLPVQTPVLCAALADTEEAEAARTILEQAPAPPCFSFSAAAVVNVRWESRGQGAGAAWFSWRIEQPCWLPPVKAAKGGAS
jgi:hypothetical protein